ncbi:MAG: hypothetical protein RLO08_00400 [Parvibaculaceae bacterium]
MTRFMRVIHVFLLFPVVKDVDGPDKPGHDDIGGGEKEAMPYPRFR